jgi:hypothetical protein
VDQTIRAPFAMLNLSEVIEPQEFVDQMTR